MKRKNLLFVIPLLLLSSCGKKVSSSSTPKSSTTPSPVSSSTVSSPTVSSTTSEKVVLSTHEDFIKAKNNDVLYIKAHLNYVTKEFGSNHNYFFQDNDGGYHCLGTISLEEGYTYIIKGSKTYNNASKQHQLTGISVISKEAEDIAVTPKDIIDIYDDENFMVNGQGTLVSVSSLMFSMSQNFNDNKKVIVTARREANATGLRLLNFRDYVNQDNFDAINNVLKNIAVNTEFSITRGIFINDYGVPEVLLLSSDDITGGKASEEERIYNLVTNNIKINAYSNSSLTLNNVIAGENVTWTSNNPDIISNSGEIVGTITEATPVSFTLNIQSISRNVTYSTTLVPLVENVTAETVSPDLFISEVYEGTAYNNHAIEIYNNTGKDVLLDDYSVIQYVNGDTGDVIKQQLTGTLKNKECLVIYDDQKIDIQAFQTHINSIKKEGIMTLASPVAHFNSNDPISLLKQNTVIDTIGTPGKLSNFMNNVTYYRNSNCYMPETHWNSKNWTWVSNDSNSTNVFSDLGYHEIGEVTE